jgi:hypothetical protein
METSNAQAVQAPEAVFYRCVLQHLEASGIPFLLGGALAFSHYSHVPRNT